MNIRIYNARIVTMAEDGKVIDGEIWIKGKRILYIGDGSDIDRIFCGEKERVIVWDREIDAGRNLIMPGFKNGHTHSGMTFLRSYADDLPLQEWLNQKIFPMEAKLTADDICLLTKLAILEYLTSGITSFFDMYLTPLSIARAAEETGMRCVQVGAVNDFSQSVELVDEMYQKLNQPDSLNSYRLGFHAEYTCSEELLKEVSALAHKYKAPVYTHNSETRREVDECIARTGKTPTEYLDSLGMFDYGGGGYHCVYLSDSDIEIFRKRGMNVILNPASNLKLASGIAPVEQYVKEGLNVAIGTDGPASNNCLDMFREMFLVTGLAKFKENDASAMDADKVLFMATVGGARAMGLKDCDVLAEGKYADLIMIDLNQPNMQPIHNLTKNLVYSGSKQNVKMTMVDGRILYEDGTFHIGETPEVIYKEADKIVQRMKESS